MVVIERINQVLQLRYRPALFDDQVDRLLARGFEDGGFLPLVIEHRLHIFGRGGHEEEPQRAVGGLGIGGSRSHQANGLDASLGEKPLAIMQ